MNPGGLLAAHRPLPKSLYGLGEPGPNGERQLCTLEVDAVEPLQVRGHLDDSPNELEQANLGWPNGSVNGKVDAYGESRHPRQRITRRYARVTYPSARGCDPRSGSTSEALTSDSTPDLWITASQVMWRDV